MLDLRPAIETINELAPAALYVLEVAEGRCVSANAAFAECLGYAPDAIPALQAEMMAALIHPDDRARFTQHLGTPDTAGASPGPPIEYRMRHRNGEWRWFCSRHRVLSRRPDGSIGQVIGAALDITERKRVEERLRESEERLRLATEGATVGVWIRDVATGRVTWSPQLEAIFGLPEGAFAENEQAFYERVHPEDRDRIWGEVEAAVARQQEYEIEFRYLHASGEVRWMVGRGRAFYDDNGAPLLLAGNGIDITARKRAEQALEESRDRERAFREQLAALHEVSLELADVPTGDDLCRRAVELGRSRLGFERLGLWLRVGETWEMQGSFGTDESGRTRDERNERITLAADFPQAALLTGKERLLRVEDYPLYDQHEQRRRGTVLLAGLWDGHRSIGYLSADNFLSGRSVSDQQDEILTLYATTLGHLLTRKRLEEELRQRADALTEADSRKDQFLAMLAHELRNPLAPIRNAVELIQRLEPEDRAPRLPRSLEMIDRQVRHMSRLIDDLLDVSRITCGKITLHRERLDLVSLARDIGEDHHRVMEEAGLALVLELPAEPVWVEGDPTRLSQVIGNLLHNAAKFTRFGGRVTVGLRINASESTRRHGDMEATEAAGQEGENQDLSSDRNSVGSVPPCLRVDSEAGPQPPSAILTVRDTGIGMEPEVLARVFEPFTQADQSLDRGQGGLGLGLALVKGLVTLHGGEVSAESAGAGQGASITLRLPLAGASGTSPISSSETHRFMKPLRLLIVEDNRDAAESLHDVLELFGCTVTIAYTGLEALERAREFRPEIVLCDLGLPGMDGFQVARELRRATDTAGARLIAVSGYGQEEDQRRSREAGFDLHLTKPVDFAQLQQLIEAASRPQQPPRREGREPL